MPVDLARLKALAEAATPGNRKVSGATIVWSPEAKSVICACGQPRPDSGRVEYQEAELGSLDVPGANADFIAATDPQAILALTHVAEAAKTVDDCWGVGYRDKGKLIEHMSHFMADLHAALHGEVSDAK